MHKIKRILELNLQHENAPFTISFVVHLRLTWATSCELDPISYACENSLLILTQVDQA